MNITLAFIRFMLAQSVTDKRRTWRNLRKLGNKRAGTWDRTPKKKAPSA